ncbi:MAG TPA: radical SAM protein [Acidimicrobiales bacterium]|nr:radical SAM protein [Acidimicrobiales bacterium]
MEPGDGKLRWRLADEDDGRGQGALFAADELVEHHIGTGEFRGMEFLHVNAKTIINEVPAASRMPFRYTINAYRGCSHACTYCFARPTHEYLGLDVGADFERRIVVKINAVERLRAELAGRRWAGDHIAMGTNTDPYQRCEGKYHLTRGVIEVLADAANPFSILTKSTLILRDLPLLAEAARRTDVRASLSIGTLDTDVWRLTEPGTPHPRQRVQAIRRLTDAGVLCGVLIAPILPGLSDSDEQLAEVVEACVAAGAESISSVGLHLRPGVREYFLGRLAVSHPELAAEYDRRYRRAYLPAADRDALTGRIRRLVTAARGRHGGTGRTGHEAFRPASASAAAPAGDTGNDSLSESQLFFNLSGTS